MVGEPCSSPTFSESQHLTKDTSVLLTLQDPSSELPLSAFGLWNYLYCFCSCDVCFLFYILLYYIFLIKLHQNSYSLIIFISLECKLKIFFLKIFYLLQKYLMLKYMLPLNSIFEVQLTCNLLVSDIQHNYLLFIYIME